jgi:hypothetical protein
MSYFDELSPLFLNWLRSGSAVGRGNPQWELPALSAKYGWYPGWRPGMPPAPGNSPGLRLGGTYVPRGLNGQGQPKFVQVSPPTALDAARAAGAGSLAPAGPRMATPLDMARSGSPPGAGPSFAQGGSLTPPAPSGLMGGGPASGVAPAARQGYPGAPVRPFPGNGPINAEFSTAPGPLPPSGTPALPKPSTPPGWAGPGSNVLSDASKAGLIGAGVAGGAAALGAGGPSLPAGGTPGDDPDQAGRQIGNYWNPNGPQFGPMLPPGSAPRRPVPMPRPRPPGPMAQGGYQDPGVFNGLGRGFAGSGSPDLTPDQLRRLLASGYGSLVDVRRLGGR